MTSHVRRYHRYHGSSGHVWQGRFKSFIIQKDSHLLMVLRYVEGNPVRAGIVNSAKDWLWSSHLERTGAKSLGILDVVPIEMPKDWSRYVDEPFTSSELEKLRQSVNRQSPYGVSLWQMQVSKELELESTHRIRGRPKKKIK